MTVDDETSETTLQRLYGVQTDPTSRWRATVLAGAFGALLATVHWSGLLVGGALVGLAWPTLRRALVAGLGFGVAVVAVFALELALAGTLGAVLAMGVFGVVPAAVPLVAGPLGAALRGLFPDVETA